MAVGINDKLDAFEALCIERGACPEALDYTALARQRDWTVREYIENAQAEHPDEYAAWAMWCRIVLEDMITLPVRLAFTDEATREDPRMAAHIDIYVATSKSEGDLVASRWTADEFPNIARQLNAGVVQRRRN